MKFAFKNWPILLLLIPLICLAILALALIQNSNNMLPLLAKATPHCETCINYGGPGNGIPPAGGSCGNVGRLDKDNPFRGWPLKFWPGNWNIVTAWYCDPQYFLDYHSNHWGIDLARLDWSADPSHSIEGAEVIVATELAIVRQVGYCNPACYNWGMGNFVQIEALVRQPECTYDPLSRTTICGFIWVPSGWIATYMHLHDVQVEVDEHVSRNHTVGHVDNTGNSSGPHLHYQINDPSKHPVDPAPTMDGGYTDELRTQWKGTR
jgi:murein DD-endopeptidase MepM/ murein hydrolase activator NlpD